jgi:Clostridium epsilon toxin ETX/Bacillus mosquitocidal toxin MTX2
MGVGMGPLESAPGVAVAAGGAQYVFWKGTDNNLWEAFWDGAQWHGPIGLGMGPLGSEPAAGVDGQNRQYVFWKGTDSNPWEGWWDGTRWNGPAALSSSANHLGEGQYLHVTDYLESPNKTCWAQLIKEQGGDFRVYRGEYPSTASGYIWSLPLPVQGVTGPVFDRPDIVLTMQADGNLVVYTSESLPRKPMWASNTVRQDAEHSYLASLQDSGEILLTNGPAGTTPYWHSPADPLTDFEIASIDYDLAHGQILSDTPETAWSEELTNDTSVSQTTAYQHTTSLATSSGWSDSLAIKVGTQTTFSTEIPFLDAGIQLSIEVTSTFTWNGSTTTTTTDQVSVPVTVPAHSKVTATGIFTHTTLSVPYAMQGNFVYKSGKKAPGTIYGTYVGISAHDVQVIFSQPTSN